MIPWRREWLPTPVCLLGEFHGQRSSVSYSPWGHKEWYTKSGTRLSEFYFHFHFHLLLSLGSYLVLNYSKSLHSINFYQVILFLPTFSIFQFLLEFLIWPMSLFLLQNNISEVVVLNEWIYTNLNVHLTTTT